MFSALDDVGHGVRIGGTPRQKQRGSSQGSIQSIGGVSLNSAIMVGPAPTTKPPTPPQVTRTGSKGIFCSDSSVEMSKIPGA